MKPNPTPTHKQSLSVARLVPSPAGRRVGDEGAQYEQAIARSLPLLAGEDRGEGAQRVAEILEA
jgi:hypothetical protein